MVSAGGRLGAAPTGVTRLSVSLAELGVAAVLNAPAAAIGVVADAGLAPAAPIPGAILPVAGAFLIVSGDAMRAIAAVAADTGAMGAAFAPCGLVEAVRELTGRFTAARSNTEAETEEETGEVIEICGAREGATTAAGIPGSDAGESVISSARVFGEAITSG
jgi:hypothetical protein